MKGEWSRQTADKIKLRYELLLTCWVWRWWRCSMMTRRTFQQDGDNIGTGTTRSLDNSWLGTIFYWTPVPGWIRLRCCCSVCSVEEIALYVNSSSAASSWSLKGARDPPSCRWRGPWCWWTCAGAPRGWLRQQTRRRVRVAWQNYPWEVTN